MRITTIDVKAPMATLFMRFAPLNRKMKAATKIVVDNQYGNLPRSKKMYAAHSPIANMILYVGFSVKWVVLGGACTLDSLSSELMSASTSLRRFFEIPLTKRLMPSSMRTPASIDGTKPGHAYHSYPYMLHGMRKLLRRKETPTNMIRTPLLISAFSMTNHFPLLILG